MSSRPVPSVYSYRSPWLIHQALLQCDRHSSFRQRRSKFDQRTTDTDTRATGNKHDTRSNRPRVKHPSPVVTQTEYDQNSGMNEKTATLKTVRTAFTVRGLQRPPTNSQYNISNTNYTSTFSINEKTLYFDKKITVIKYTSRASLHQPYPHIRSSAFTRSNTGISVTVLF